jgi:hypothetical protein
MNGCKVNTHKYSNIIKTLSLRRAASICVTILITLLSGCGDKFSSVNLEDALPLAKPDIVESHAEPEQSQPAVYDVNIPEHSAAVDAAPAAVSIMPVSLKYISKEESKKIFDEIMGDSESIYFVQKGNSETFVVFDDEGHAIKMAQLRLIGNSKGFIAVVAGISTDRQMPLLSRIYVLEHGVSTPAIKPFHKGKERFLKQFENRKLSKRIGKVDGITGATPIWKPISAEIKKLIASLLKLKADTTGLAKLKEDSHLWLRNPKTPANIPPDTDLNKSEDDIVQAVIKPVQQVVAVLENLVSEKVTTKPVESDFNMQGDFEMPQDDTFEQEDILFTHYRAIGIAEVSLISLGLIIMLVGQYRRRVRT